MVEPRVRHVIVAAVEPSAASDQVVKTAVGMTALVSGAELHFVYIVDVGPAPHNTSVPLDLLIADARTFVDRVTDDASKTTTASVSGHLGLGAPAKRIVQIATDLGADLVVVGTHEKRGLARLLGSVSRRVILNAPCPVLIARTAKATDADAVSIAPPCPDCLAVQRRTHGDTLWCERHSARHVHGRLHYSHTTGFGDGSMLIRPET